MLIFRDTFRHDLWPTESMGGKAQHFWVGNYFNKFFKPCSQQQNHQQSNHLQPHVKQKLVFGVE